MRNAFLVLLILSASVSASMAQDPGRSTPQQSGSLSELDALVGPSRSKAPVRRERSDEMQRRHGAEARRAINTMCVECLGAKYNRPGPKTPLILPEELSNYQGEPQLDLEP
jgi:hypothetical protein